MYTGFMIHSSDCKHQPMDTKKDTETEKDKDNAEINNKDYETIRKPMTDYDINDKDTNIISYVIHINGKSKRELMSRRTY